MAACVEDNQSKEKYDVRVAINNGIEKGAEDCHLVSEARDAAIHHIKDASANNDQAGI